MCRCRPFGDGSTATVALVGKPPSGTAGCSMGSLGTIELNTEGLWSMTRTAEFFDIPLASLYAQRTRNQMPGALGFRVGRFVRFRPVDLFRWCENQRSDR